MRIVSGKYKRRIIAPPNNLPVRPTTDMAKESLFNIMGNHVDFREKNVLDLFAGTGNISYEFVSRGCSSVTAVDQDFGCVKFINETAQKLEMPELSVIKQDVFKFMSMSKRRFDIIFADPPYMLENIIDISNKVFEYDLLNPDGWLIIEHPGELDLSKELNFHEHRKYGRVNFSFFHKAID
ncbi:MAG: 16S rRNA (guanine(966)-N(2))-methyltransferase RsmD [Bacteroidetes bacterium]|nr:16S rRNA (guanine(966)-N(2))-methyltransferase RsmD [Bacteroidota bacterium]